MNDVETAWHHNKVVTMLMYDITGFFDTIPHAHLIQTMCTLHIPLPLVKWVYSFLQNRKAMVRLDRKQDPLSYINTGVPQGSCTSPILVAYFTAPLSKAIHTGAMTKLNQLASIANNIQTKQAAIAPHTLYVNDRSISAAEYSREESTQIIKSACESPHNRLSPPALTT